MSQQPSRIFDLWRRLYTRFLIEPRPAADTDSPGVSTTILPVTDADELLRQHGIQSVNTASFNADGVQGFLTVPAGKLWRTSFIEILRVSGNRTLIDVRIESVRVSLIIRLRSFGAASEALLDLGSVLVMEEGDRVSFTANGGSTATIYTIRCWASEEDAF